MTCAVIWLRSWIYLVAFLTWTIAASVLLIPTLFRQSWARVTTRIWVRGVMVLARTIVHVDCRVEGRDNIPDGPCIIAAQHQSSYETYRIFLEVPQPIFVLKRELAAIPIIGWYMWRSGMVAIDRVAGANAMRSVLHAAEQALAKGEQIVLFPEGTRVPPGERQPYQPGIMALYRHCDVPVIPMALNSGDLWGKTRILKKPGIIVMRFLPALPQGLEKNAMLALLRERIESANL